jgi:hypothetical protein
VTSDSNHKIRHLRGAKAIGDYIGEPQRRVYHLEKAKLAPIGREGSSLIADPRLLDEHYARITQIEVRPRPADAQPVKPPLPPVRKRRLTRPSASRPSEPQPLVAKRDGQADE